MEKENLENIDEKDVEKQVDQAEENVAAEQVAAEVVDGVAENVEHEVAVENNLEAQAEEEQPSAQEDKEENKELEAAAAYAQELFGEQDIEVESNVEAEEVVVSVGSKEVVISETGELKQETEEERRAREEEYDAEPETEENIIEEVATKKPSAKVQTLREKWQTWSMAKKSSIVAAVAAGVLFVTALIAGGTTIGIGVEQTNKAKATIAEVSKTIEEVEPEIQALSGKQNGSVKENVSFGSSNVAKEDENVTIQSLKNLVLQAENADKLNQTMIDQLNRYLHTLNTQQSEQGQVVGNVQGKVEEVGKQRLLFGNTKQQIGDLSGRIGGEGGIVDQNANNAAELKDLSERITALAVKFADQNSEIVMPKPSVVNQWMQGKTPLRKLMAQGGTVSPAEVVDCQYVENSGIEIVATVGDGFSSGIVGLVKATIKCSEDELRGKDEAALKSLIEEKIAENQAETSFAYNVAALGIGGTVMVGDVELPTESVFAVVTPKILNNKDGSVAGVEYSTDFYAYAASAGAVNNSNANGATVVKLPSGKTVTYSSNYEASTSGVVRDALGIVMEAEME